ncbi:MAG: glycoside hydrolase family 78 protein [Verrucomicrobiota bacterium]
MAIDTLQPRLSWVLESKDRGVRQSAYQVLVASSLEALKKNQGDLWDSGKVASDETIHIAYAGKALTSSQVCFWKVQVWDQAGKASKWSQPATWTMGLLQPGDWQAQWIGFPALEAAYSKFEQLLSLDGCAWVWASGAVTGNQPRGKVYFRKQLELPVHTPVGRAKFVLTADDNLQLYVNGQPAGGSHRNWKQLATRDVASLLRPGANLLAIEAENTGENPAGLAGRLVIEFVNGDTLFVPIDQSWRSSRNVSANWQESREGGADWQSAAEIVRYGDQPWGTIARQITSPTPFFRKPFTVTKPIQRATVFAAALGVYELHLNGKPVDTDVLSPGWTDFSKRAHYRGYDVTKQLQRGENVVGAILGDGWYASYLAFTGKRHYYGGDPRLRVQLQIEYQDGTREVIGTDASWQTAVGPIQEADLLMGCAYDARAEFVGWNKPGFAGDKWQPAQVDSVVQANLVAHPGEPMRRTEEVAAKKITEPKPNVYVFDLGQNMVGWARLKVKGKPGQKVTVRHAEMLNPDGTIYITNLRAALATDSYILADAGQRTFEPYFTFHGFQYVEVTGLDYKPELTDVVGVVVHSDLPRAGWFECSEPLVNKLTLNSIWGQRGNFLDVPTDCPQRDERAGWTGDAQVFMKTACLNLDSAAFYTKWLRDLCADSQRADGGFGDVAPHLKVVGFGNTGWTDAGPICAWRMFEMYGDARVLAEHYPALQRHMDYLAKTSKDFVRGTGDFGDWLRLTGPQHSDAIGTAYYYYTTRTMADIAAALGKSEDATKYRALAGDIRTAFGKNFIKSDGRIVDAKNETGQTFYALAFGLDLVPADMKPKVAEQFVASLAREKDHIATGFLGTPFILFALQQAGHPELAYKLVLNKTYPGWLQQVIWGSTTMWERWDGWRPEKGFQDAGMNSFNHYWLGCVSEWLITQTAGIDTHGPGFKNIVIRPEIVKPDQSFSWVKAKYNSIRGPVASSWQRNGERLDLNISIPANTTATVYLPARDGAQVTEGGKSIARAAGVKFLGMQEGSAVLEVGSGQYKFSSIVGARR